MRRILKHKRFNFPMKVKKIKLNFNFFANFGMISSVTNNFQTVFVFFFFKKNNLVQLLVVVGNPDLMPEFSVDCSVEGKKI